MADTYFIVIIVIIIYIVLPSSIIIYLVKRNSILQNNLLGHINIQNIENNIMLFYESFMRIGMTKKNIKTARLRAGINIFFVRFFGWL